MLDVYSTPTMVALMEKTSLHCPEEFLDQLVTSVGGELNIRHLKPISIGRKVHCKSKAVDVSGKRVVFEVFENDTTIGTSTHTRFVIDRKVFIKSVC